jgi:hypothetical protein
LYSTNVCTKCGKYVQVCTKPQPNEIDIGGTAVALNCKNIKTSSYIDQTEARNDFDPEVSFCEVCDGRGKVKDFLSLGDPYTLEHPESVDNENQRGPLDWMECDGCGGTGLTASSDECGGTGIIASRAPSRSRPDIATEIRKGLRPQGVELTEKDLGKYYEGPGISDDFIKKIDVGKKVWLKDYGIAIENNEQRDKRKGVSKTQASTAARLKSMTWGVMPPFEEFAEAAKEHMPFDMELNDADAEALAPYIQALPKGSYSTGYGLYEKDYIAIEDTRALYDLVSDMAEDFDNDRVRDTASSIMDIVGYEWV